MSNTSHVYYNTLGQNPLNRGSVLCSEGKTGDFEIFEFVLRSLYIVATFVLLILCKGDLTSFGGSEKATRAKTLSGLKGLN